MQKQYEICATVLDFDGTLTDFVSSGIGALQIVAQQLGLRVPPTEELRPLWGWHQDRMLKRVWPDADPQTIADAWRVHNRTNNVPYSAHPGAVDVVRFFHTRMRAVALLTNRHDETRLHYRLTAAGFSLSLFHVIQWASGITPVKPDPRALQHLLDKLQAQRGVQDPRRVCMISDQSEDAAMAFACGCRFVGVLTGASTRDDFARLDGRGVLCIADSIADVPAVLGLAENLSE